MKKLTILLGIALAAVAAACTARGAMPAAGSAAAGGRDAATASAAVTTAAEPVLLFAIGMHIEPLGATAQQSGTVTTSGPGGKTSAGYASPEAFNRGVADIQAVAGIVEEHGGVLTVQTQSPFTTAAVANGSTILSDLEDAGHEIGLHFHEDAHLGRNANTLTPSQWCSVLKQEIGFIHQAGVEGDISYWSGGNLYPQLYEAAACAGLSVNSDWKNPSTQETALELVGTLPWRPAGGTDGTDLTAFATHDPDGAVVFLPEGNYDRSNFAASRRSETAGGDQAYFDYLAEQLQRSLDVAVAGKVNVFHFTVHPGEFRGDRNNQFAVIERFLAEVVDPLVAAGKVQWATFSEMAAAFEAWEAEHPGEDPRSTQPSATAAAAAATAAPASAPTAAPASAPTAPSAAPAGGSRKPTKSVPGATAGKVERDVTYCTGNGAALKMDIYYPANSSGSAPAVLYVHGGGWSGGDKSGGTGSETIPALVEQGFLVAAVNYRLAPQDKWPAQIEDVKCAVRFLRANAAQYGIDPNSIGAMGGSAGGHLVAMLGVTDGDEGFEGTGGWAGVSSRVQAVVDMFGPTDLTIDFEGASSQTIKGVFGVASRPSDVLKNASPVTWASGDDPAFLILHGENDSLVPLSQSQALYNALTRSGAKARLVVVKNAGHGFKQEGGAMSPSRAEISAMIVEFFASTLK